MPYLGTHWYNDKTITNIISLADIAKQYRVTMNTEYDKSFTVYLPDKIVKFPQLKGGLYRRNPNTLGNKSAQLTSILKK